MDYNYKFSFEANKKELKPFRDFIYKEFHMKPDTKFVNTKKYYKEEGKIYVTCYGYSIEEKAKNKKMLFQAIHDFRKWYFEQSLKIIITICSIQNMN
jgi:hypothetical protein